MTRPRSRTLTFALLTLTLGVVAAAARGQSGNIDLKPYRMDAKQITGEDAVRLQEMRAGKERTAGPKFNENRQLFKRAAQFLVYRITQDQYYTGGDTGELKPRTGDQNLDRAFEDLEINYLLVPKPGEQISLDRVDYIREFGAALDEAVVAVLTKMPLPVIRINAARMLALAAKSGAPAHGKTITALLTNQFFKTKDGKPMETPPEVLYWAMKAAEYLLAAPDPTGLSTTNPARHTLKNEELVPLVQALNNLVLNNPQVADKAAVLNPDLAVKPPAPPPSTAPGATPPEAQPKEPSAPGGKLDPKALTPEQLGLVRYYRRQAIRALAKVRFDAVGGDGTPEVRCGYTLVKVAVNDASINPAPAVAEVGEAVIGLCGINPSSNLNVDFLLNVAAYGTDLFFSQKVGRMEDKLLPWKLYAARVSAAYVGMQKNAQVNPRLSPFKQQINALAGIVTADVTDPLEKGGDQTSPPRVERLTQWIQDNQAKAGLYGDSQQYRLTPRPRQ
jgi:hypothetical protein